MILSTHILSGAVVGKTFGNPWLITAISIALHFILDTFRHGEYLNPKSKWNEFWKVAIDIGIGIGILYAIISFSDFSKETVLNISLGAFFSLFPDFLTLLYWKLGVKSLKKYYDFHSWLHSHPNFSKEKEWNLRNSINDLITSATSILLLLL